MDHHAGLGDLLQAGLALDDDQRAVTLGRQPGRGAGDLGGDDLGHPGLGRDEPAERAHAPDAIERPAKLRLEHDDEREQADDGARLEDLGEQPQREQAGREVHDEQRPSRR